MEIKFRLDLVALINLDKFEAFEESIRQEQQYARLNNTLAPYITVNGKGYYTYGQFVHIYRRGGFTGRDVVELHFEKHDFIPRGFLMIDLSDN